MFELHDTLNEVKGIPHGLDKTLITEVKENQIEIRKSLIQAGIINFT